MMDSKARSHPLVSVIITNYNYARYLEECIEGVLSQTYQEYELIIVDDGSTDDSPKIIEAYRCQHPNKITAIFKENGGQASAFNTGFRASSGDIISFLDSDDFWVPDRLERVVNVHKEGIYSIIQHNMEIVDGNSQLQGMVYRKDLFTGDARKMVIDFCQHDLFVPTSGVCFERGALEEVFPVPEHWKICADVYCTRTALFYGFLFSFEQPLGFYRIHGKNNWMLTDGHKTTDRFPIIVELINNHLHRKGFGIRVEESRNPLYRYKNIGQRRELLEPVTVMRMLPTFPFISTKQKLRLVLRLSLVVLSRLRRWYFSTCSPEQRKPNSDLTRKWPK